MLKENFLYMHGTVENMSKNLKNMDGCPGLVVHKLWLNCLSQSFNLIKPIVFIGNMRRPNKMILVSF